jgi:hypothetical protein
MSPRKTWSFNLSLVVIISTLLGCETQQTVSLEVCTNSDEYCSSSTNNYSEFIGHYTFPTAPIKTFECKSKEAIAEMKNGVCNDLLICFYFKEGNAGHPRCASH